MVFSNRIFHIYMEFVHSINNLIIKDNGTKVKYKEKDYFKL